MEEHPVHPCISGQKAGPSISVIIPAYEAGENFSRCLRSLAGANPPPDETIVVADGGMPHPPPLLAELGAQVLETPIARGPARARNLGAKKATSDILLFLDSDVTIMPDIIKRVSDIFLEDPYLAAVFGSYDDEPAAANFLSQYKNLIHHYVHQTGRREASTFWGACGAIRREVFLSLGGFDETYRQPSVEDIELGYRLKKGGYQVRLINPNRKIFEARKRETAALGAREKLVLGHPLAATIGDSARCMQNLEKVLFTGPKTSDTVTFICD